MSARRALLLALAAVGSFGCGLSTRTAGEEEPLALSPCGDAMASCAVDQCEGGVCALVALAAAVGEVFGVDGDYVYSATGHELFRTPKCGGRSETLALSQDAFQTPRLLGDAVYFRFAARPTSVFRVPAGGGASEELAGDGGASVYLPSDLLPLGAHAYLASSSGLFAYPLSGGLPVQVFAGGVASKLGSDGGAVYFFAGTPEVALYRASGSEPASPFFAATSSGVPASGSVAAGDADALFTVLAPLHQVPATLVRIDKLDKTTLPVAELGKAPSSIAVDERCVYLSSDGGATGGIRRVPKAGGELELLAGAAASFALDEGAYYFASGGYLFRRPK